MDKIFRDCKFKNYQRITEKAVAKFDENWKETKSKGRQLRSKELKGKNQK